MVEAPRPLAMPADAAVAAADDVLVVVAVVAVLWRKRRSNFLGQKVAPIFR